MFRGFHLRRPAIALACALAAIPALAPLASQGHAAGADGLSLITRLDAAPDSVKGQVWAVTRDATGRLYIGSNVLSCFDGDRWQTLPAPSSAYGFRGLAIATGADRVARLFVGAIGVIGYIPLGPTADRQFVSLTDEVNRRLGAFGDVWSTHPVGDGAVWVLDQAIVRWSDSRLDVFPMPCPRRLTGFSDPEGKHMWLYRPGTGLLRVDATGAPQEIVSDKQIPGTGVSWLLPEAEGFLIGIGDNAYRLARPDRGAPPALELFASLSAALRGTVPSAATWADGNHFAVATLTRGVFVADRTGQVVASADADSGLPDDTVHTLFGERGHLWIGLSNGLARLDSPAFARRFDRGHGLSAGAVVKILNHEGRTTVVTTKGVWRRPLGSSVAPVRITPPPLNDETYLRDATVADHALWTAGYGALRRFGGRVETPYRSPGDIFGVTSDGADGVFVLEAHRLRRLVPGANGWVPRDFGAAVDDTPVSLLASPGRDGTPARTLWVSTMRGGIYRFDWEDIDEAHGKTRLTAQTHFTSGRGLPNPTRRPVLVAWNDQLYAFSEEGILKAGELAFTPAPGWENDIGIAASQPMPNGDAFWVLRTRSAPSRHFALIRLHASDNDARPVLERLDCPGLDTLDDITAIAVAGTTNDELWIGGTDGVIAVEIASLDPAPAPPAVFLTPADAPQKFADAPLRYPAKTSAITFHFPSPASTTQPGITYRTRLRGSESDWSAPTTEATRRFSALAPGDYTFEAQAIDRFGRPGPTVTLRFTQLAPWYRTRLAWAAYIASAVMLLVAGIRWRINRLRRQNERLSQLVQERTRELELSNRAKNEFLENLSHELRNPLHGVMGLTARFREDELSDAQREHMRTLKGAVGQLSRAFEDVLGFSKLEYGYVKVGRQAFRLSEAIEEVRTLHAAAADQRGCTIAIVRLVDGAPAEPTPDNDTFIGDRAKLKTVVGNFLSNAIKYGGGSSVTLRIDVAEPDTDTAGDRVAGLASIMIEVIDRGPGIPVAEQELIFKKFVRGSGAAGQAAGTGLGLATCAMLAKLMNGSVGLDSLPGRGSTFFLDLLLPRAKPQSASPQTTAPTASAKHPATAPDQLGATTLALVVEDEPYNQTLLVDIAHELGYRTVTADRAEKAMQIWQETRPQIIFLDWELPDGNGGEIAQSIRASEDGAAPILIATTAHDSDEIRTSCRRAGMDGFLLKPYDTARVREILDHAQQARGKSGHPTGADDPARAPARMAPASDELNLRALIRFAQSQGRPPADAALLYSEALAGELKRLQSTVSEHHGRNIAEAAHRLKGLAAAVNARDLKAAAAKLEQRPETLPPIERTRLFQDVERTAAALLRLIATTTAAHRTTDPIEQDAR